MEKTDGRDRYFSDEAANYDFARRNKKSIVSDQEDLQYFLANVAKERSVILDIPCGTGRAVQDIKNIFHEYVGVDISRDMLEQLSVSFGDEKTMIGDMTKIPLPDKSVDYVVSLKGIKWLGSADEVYEALREFKRVSRLGMFLNIKTNTKKKEVKKFNLSSLYKILSSLRQALKKRKAGGGGKQEVEFQPLSLDSCWFESALTGLGLSVHEIRSNSASKKVKNYIVLVND